MNLISEKYYSLCFKDYFIQDCSIIDANRFIFSCRNLEDCGTYDPEEEYFVRKQLSWCMVRENKEIIGGSKTAQKFGYIYACATAQEGIFIDTDGAVCVLDADGCRQEEHIYTLWKQKNINNINVFYVNTICGAIYGCGAQGLAFRRIGKNHWEYIGYPMDAAEDCLLNNSFTGIDGFSHNDIYAVGGHGRVWHYNGTAWALLTFPSNIPLESVCCGQDGNVYISGQAGTVFQGREHTWKMLHSGNSLLPYTDMVWFDDAVWCTHDYGLWTIRDGIFSKADVPNAVLQCSGNLSSSQDALLVGGMGGAAWYNGTQWNILYHQPEDERIDN